MALTKAQKEAAAKKAAKVTNPLLNGEEAGVTAPPVAPVVTAESEKAAETFDPAKVDVVAQKEAAVKLTEEQQHAADIERFKKEIEAGPKTMFMVPLDPGEKAGAVQPVSLNGVAFTIKKGAMVTIPVAIAEVLAEKFQVEMEAGQDKLIDRSDAVSDALS